MVAEELEAGAWLHSAGPAPPLLGGRQVDPALRQAADPPLCIIAACQAPQSPASLAAVD